MFSGAVSAFIQAPPETIFEYVADIGRHSEWGAQRQEVAPISGYSPDGAFAASIHLGPLALPSRIRVIEKQAPTRLVYECLDWSGHYRWTMLLHPEGSGVRLTHRVERIQGPLWIRLIQGWFLWPFFGSRYARNGLAHIKARLEAGNYATNSAAHEADSTTS